MEDELACSFDGKTVGSLRVVDLKLELEKRGLSKSGSKKDLVKRLKQQLEFEKLSDERKLTAGGDLKLELDAVTEQNEFVQQYLAQQQKLFAEQNETKSNSETEEIQGSDDDEENDDLPLPDENKVSVSVAVNKSKQNDQSDSSKVKDKCIKEHSDNNTSETKKKRSHIVETIHVSVINHSASEETSDSNLTCIQSETNMEPTTKCPSVPYSLSDIQLPDSPGKELSKSATSENCQHPESSSTAGSETDATMKTNGIELSDSKRSFEVQEPASAQLLVDSDQNHKSLSEDKNLLHDEQSKKSDKNSDDEVNSKISNPEDVNKSTAPKSIALQSKTKNNREDKTFSKSSEKGKESQTSDSENEKSSNSDQSERHVKSNKTGKNKRRSSTESNSSQSSESSPERSQKKSSKLKEPPYNVEKTEVKKTKKQAVEENLNKEEINKTPKQKLKIKRNNIPVLEESKKIESSNKIPVSQDDSKSKASSVTSPSANTQNSQIETSEVTEEIPKPYVSRKVTLLNRKQSCSSVEEKDDDPKQKKSKWGSFASLQKSSRVINISTNSLKSWFPDFKLISEPVPVTDMIPTEHSPAISEEKFISPFSNNEIATHKKSVPKLEVFEQNVQMELEESVEHGPVTNIIFIQNLVRPFTLQQLKDLLKQSGNIIEDEFWIDKIKSKCIVMYETEESAIKAKTSLNNARWPPSNPKILTVQYINEDEVEFHKRGGEPPKAALEPPKETVDNFEVKPVMPLEEHKKRDKEHRKEREKSKLQQHVREWDKDKIIQGSPESERIVNKENEKIRTSEKKESKRRANEDTPAKLLDDLFQKTKASPCIYWLPLTEEQMRERAEEKRVRRLEREKRLQKEKEHEDNERKNRVSRLSRRSREMESPRSSTRSRSPVSRKR